MSDNKPRVLWVSRNCLLDVSSGASISARLMLAQLKRRGWEVSILTGFSFDAENGMLPIKSRLPEIAGKKAMKYTDDYGLSHEVVVFRQVAAGAATLDELDLLYARYREVLSQFKPDFVFYYGGHSFDFHISGEARRVGAKVLTLVVNGNYLSSDMWARDVDLVLTDSQATASLYRDKLGLTLHPVGAFINPDRVLSSRRDPRHVLFVNPSLSKGAAVVAALAILAARERPDLIFEVVESRSNWRTVLTGVSKALGEEVSSLPNVVVTPQQMDMKDVYSRAKVLLAPSLWWESFGMVAAEAMMNGIPLIYTNRGGLPEVAAGTGVAINLPEGYHEPPFSKLLVLDDVAPILASIARFFDDADYYRDESTKAARTGAERHGLAACTDRLINAFVRAARM